MDPLALSLADSDGGREPKDCAGAQAMEKPNPSIHFTSHFGRSGPPMGIYVLSVVLVILACLCGAAYFGVPRPLKLFVGILVPIFLLFSFGIALRINVARLVLVQVLAVGLFMEAVLIFNSMRADMPSRVPVFPTAARISLTVWTLAYLLRRDVRAAFGAIEPPAGENGEVRTNSTPNE